MKKLYFFTLILVIAVAFASTNVAHAQAPSDESSDASTNVTAQVTTQPTDESSSGSGNQTTAPSDESSDGSGSQTIPNAPTDESSDGSGNQPTTPTTPTTSTTPTTQAVGPQGGSSAPGGFSGGGSTSGGLTTGTPVSGTFTEPTLAMCPNAKMVLTSYLKYGKKNNVKDMIRLKAFLNKNLGLKLNVNGTFDLATFKAVKAFQSKYKTEVLLPWDQAGLSVDLINNPTGYVYKTTKRQITVLQCPMWNVAMPILP